MSGVKFDRIVFFGTPRFAVPTLEALHAAGRTPYLVVSQPSRGAGRGRSVRLPPVAQWAVDHGVELLQPERVRRRSFLDTLGETAPDLAVVVAFGQIFPQSLLDLPRYGCINVHASLLPAWRGAAPIAAAIRNGDPVTGVTTMRMEAGLDSGPSLERVETEIGVEETCGELTIRLADLGARLLVRTLDDLEAGALDLEGTPQDDAAATFAPTLDRTDGVVDWGCDASQIERSVRAHDPWPGSRSTLGGKDLVLRTVAVASDSSTTADDRAEEDLAPGTLIGLRADALEVACGGATRLLLLRVQRPGRKPVSGRDLWNGERLQRGLRLGG